MRFHALAFAAVVLIVMAGCNKPSQDAITTVLPDQLERTWIGPDFYANRFMDWRINDGRIECLEGRSEKPMRTLHLLTRALSEKPGSVSMSVRTGPLVPYDSAHTNTWTGFLLGAGGAHVDYRISSLTHHWPGDDGGLIVGLDGTGAIVVRDNTNPDAPKGPASSITVDAWPLIEPDSTNVMGVPTTDIRLALQAEPDGAAYMLHVTAQDAKTGAPISSARYSGIPVEQLTGNVALVSHNSPRMEGPGYWFTEWDLDGTKVERHDDRAFGPIMGTQYTVSGDVLKMTAQLAQLGASDTRSAHLEINRNNSWERVASGELIDHSFTVPFRVENWIDTKDVPYRVTYELRSKGGATTPHSFSGVIRQPRLEDEEFVLASLNCQNMSRGRNLVWNHSAIWYPHTELSAAVAKHDPDLLFFAGDQIYESGLAGIIRKPVDKAILDYQYHWLRFVWAFRDLMRDRPTVTLPDDHDVYHGNIWGDGGKRAFGELRPMSDHGGYIMDPKFVNAVHETQVSHLPDPYDPTPIEQDISVYYTALNYGGISFAIVADRMWKSTPRLVLPEADVWNGWPKNPDFDATAITEANLLGPRQLAFLEDWAHDWAGGTWMKVMLSQTLFSNLATLPAGANDDRVVPRMRFADPDEYIADDHLGIDMDSNGWPQAGRNRALRIIRKGFAFHIGGDQHLGSFVRYGIDAFNDGPNAFISPAIANIWPRRWFPPTPGANRKPGAPPYTGEHLDGFGNRITVYAVANPVRSGREPEELYDRVPGYGIIRFRADDRTITSEAWPRWVDPSDPDPMLYPGWPVTVDQRDNYGRKAAGYLPTLVVEGMANPVVRVIEEASGEVLYTLRMNGSAFVPKVFDAAATYTVRIGEPGTDKMQELPGLMIGGESLDSLTIVF